MEKIISDTLMKVGIPCHVKGFEYMKEAVRLVLEDRTMVFEPTKRLYPSIAKTFGSTPARVERCLRHGIQIAWRSEASTLYEVLGPCSMKDKITNGEFIATLAEQIAMAQKEDAC